MHLKMSSAKWQPSCLSLNLLMCYIGTDQAVLENKLALFAVPFHSIHNNVYGPFARYLKLQVTHAPGMPGTFSPPSRISDPDMHHGTCVTHVPWCMPGSLTSGFLWNWWQGKRSRYSRCMLNWQFYVSGKRSMAGLVEPSISACIPATDGTSLPNKEISHRQQANDWEETDPQFIKITHGYQFPQLYWIYLASICCLGQTLCFACFEIISDCT